MIVNGFRAGISSEEVAVISGKDVEVVRLVYYNLMQLISRNITRLQIQSRE